VVLSMRPLARLTASILESFRSRQGDKRISLLEQRLSGEIFLWRRFRMPTCHQRQQPKSELMSNTKERFLAGTILSAVAIVSVHAAPPDETLVVAQAPRSGHEKEKKPPQPPGQPPTPQQQVQPPPPPPQQREVQTPPSRHREVQPSPPQQPEVQPPPSTGDKVIVS
jgi:hypothetical protein